MIQDIIALTWKNIKTRGLRSWLTTIGVIIGIAAIVSLFTVSQGLQNAVEEQFEVLGVSNIRVVTGGLTGPPLGALRLDIDLADNIERVKAVEYVDRVLVSSAEVEFGKETFFLRVGSYDTELGQEGFADTDLQAVEGRLLQKGDNNAAVLGWSIAKDTFDDDVFARNSIIIEGRKFKVVGVFEETGGEADANIVVPLHTAQDLFGIENEVNIFIVKIRDGLDITEAAQDIRDELEKDLEDDEFDVFTPEQLLSQIQGILQIVQIVLVGIAAIALLVGGIGIMNAMFTSVLERTKEIGIMKAIGATNGTILAFFLVESGIIGLVGGAIGIVIGAAVAQVVGLGAAAFGFSLLKIVIDYKVVLFALLFAFIIGVVSGLVPAIRASRLQPVDALRYE